MNHYQDIKILPDPEFPLPMLMNALFAKLHRVLVKQQSEQIGVSFPRVEHDKFGLGDLLRLHGAKDALLALQEESWVRGIRDHLETSEIILVPDSAQHCQVRRVQVKSNAERLRRRYCKRHGVTPQEANALIPTSVEKKTKLPFLQLKSQSTKQSFRLFVRHQPPQNSLITGQFNTYGLSTTATVPWF